MELFETIIVILSIINVSLILYGKNEKNRRLFFLYQPVLISILIFKKVPILAFFIFLILFSISLHAITNQKYTEKSMREFKIFDGRVIIKLTIFILILALVGLNINTIFNSEIKLVLYEKIKHGDLLLLFLIILATPVLTIIGKKMFSVILLSLLVAIPLFSMLLNIKSQNLSLILFVQSVFTILVILLKKSNWEILIIFMILYMLCSSLILSRETK